MSKSLVDALGAGAWSLSAVIFDLNDMLDDEGRPISERRADAVVRAGVEMEMRQCPYSGIRHGKWMNVSALAQISNYYNPVLEELAAFRRQIVNGNSTWADVLAVAIDQLSRPAVYLLQQRSMQGPVPAQLAVGHKLAAGFFGVLHGMHEQLALGASLPVSGESFLQQVDMTGALVGASEVCAGSAQMIRKVSLALVEGTSDCQSVIDPLRLDIARCLALQVQLGIFWRLYDRAHLWTLIRGEQRKNLTPYNEFLTRKIEQAANDLGTVVPPRPDVRRLPEALDSRTSSKLAVALCDITDTKLLEEDFEAATALLSEPGSAIRYNGDIASFARIVAHYLHTHRIFAEEISRLELELRRLLNFPAEAPIRLGAAIFPTPLALPWYELIVGRHLGQNGHLTGSTTGVRVVALR